MKKYLFGLIALLILLPSSITKAADDKVKKKKPIRIAIGAMLTPEEGLDYYKECCHLISKKLNWPVQIEDRKTYSEINNLMEMGLIDIAFVCSGPYVEGHDKFGMELLAAPQAYGKTVYYSYTIVHKDSTIKSFEELRGKRFAFTDPKSNTGKMVPTYKLAKMGETPESFFKDSIFTYAHDKSIKEVALGHVDGAAVDSLIWEYAKITNPQLTSKTKVIEKSSPFGIPPVVVRKNLNPFLKQKFKESFLNIHNDIEGKNILKKMMIDKFVDIDDHAYNSIREMKKWIAEDKQQLLEKSKENAGP